VFSGIVEAVGRVTALSRTSAAAQLSVAPGALDLADVHRGDSICVDGICLTVADTAKTVLLFDLSPETLAVSAGFAEGQDVNLEKSLRWSDRVGGHFVAGHVDGIGQLAAIEEADGNRVIAVRFPASLRPYLARKGSIAINGVSLTVNSVSRERFSVNLIPHTLALTNLGALVKGSRVNLEVDPLARYVESVLAARRQR
jgi:riboflavin synthase